MLDKLSNMNQCVLPMLSPGGSTDNKKRLCGAIWRSRTRRMQISRVNFARRRPLCNPNRGEVNFQDDFAKPRDCNDDSHTHGDSASATENFRRSQQIPVQICTNPASSPPPPRSLSLLPCLHREENNGNKSITQDERRVGPKSVQNNSRSC